MNFLNFMTSSTGAEFPSTSGTTDSVTDAVSSTVSSVTAEAPEVTSTPFLGMFFAILLIVCAIALVVVVVLQTNRGSEMAALTGRNNNAAGRGQSAKKEMLLKRLTIGLGIVFMVLAFILNILVAHGFFD